MKNPRALIAVLFASVGVYLLIMSLTHAIIIIGSMLNAMLKYKYSLWNDMLPSLMSAVMPAIAGALLIGLANKLALWVIKFVKISSENNFFVDSTIHETTLLRGILTAFGIYFLLGQVSVLANAIQWDAILLGNYTNILNSNRIPHCIAAAVEIATCLILVVCANSFAKILFRFWAIQEKQEVK